MSFIERRLGDLVHVTAGQGAPQDAEAFSEGGYPFIRAGSLDALTNGGSEDDCEKIEPAVAARYRLRLFPTDTIIFAKSGMSATLERVYRLKRPSYVVTHLAALVPKGQVEPSFLEWWLAAHPPARLIRDNAYPSIRTSEVEEMRVLLPKLANEQKRIASLLDKADAVRRKRREALKLADEFLRSAFLDLFGDPVSNSRGWDLVPVEKMADVKTGNTPSRVVPDYYGDHIEWVKSDNINTPSHYVTKAIEGLSEAGLRVGRSVPAGSILITCIAGSPACIGNSALADRCVAFNQQINALIPHRGIEPEFLYSNVLFSKPRIQAASTQGMKGMVSKGALKQVHLIRPPPELRQRFVQLFVRVVSALHRMDVAAKESDRLFQSLSARAFNDELAAT